MMASENTEGKTSPASTDFVPKADYDKISSEFGQTKAQLAQLMSERDQLATSSAEIAAENKRLKEQSEALGKDKNQGKGKPDQAELDELTKPLRDELGTYKTKAEQLEAENKQFRLQIEVITPVMDKLAPQLSGDMVDIARQLVSNHLKKASDGSIVVLDDKGNERYSVNDPTKKMSVDEWFTELKAKRPSMFKAQGATNGTMDKGQSYNGAGATASSDEVKQFVQDPEYRKTLSPQKRTELLAEAKRLGLAK